MNQDEAEIHRDQPKKYKIYIGLAPRAQPFDESIDSLMTMIRFTQNAGIEVVLEKVKRGYPGWQNSGPLVTHMLKTDATHSFSAADDMLYPPNTIIRLLSANKDIISGIYRKCYSTILQPANYCTSVEEWQEKYNSRGVFETQYCAGYTMLAKREVFEKMIIDYPEVAYVTDGYPDEIHYGLTLPFIEDKRAFQDDWAFSIRAKRSGFKIWTDYGCTCKHYCYDFLGFELEE